MESVILIILCLEALMSSTIALRLHNPLGTVIDFTFKNRSNRLLSGEAVGLYNGFQSLQASFNLHWAILTTLTGGL